MRLPAVTRVLLAVGVWLLPPLVGCGAHVGAPSATQLEARGHAVVDRDRSNELPRPRNMLGVFVAETSTDSTPPFAPTWSMIYEQYFGRNTEGSCGRSGACHAAEMVDAASAYAWLQQRGYIAGTQSPIASTTNSCLRWFGGNMPPRGKAEPSAVRDFRAWVAAGARND